MVHQQVAVVVGCVCEGGASWRRESWDSFQVLGEWICPWNSRSVLSFPLHSPKERIRLSCAPAVGPGATQRHGRAFLEPLVPSSCFHQKVLSLSAVGVSQTAQNQDMWFLCHFSSTQIYLFLGQVLHSLSKPPSFTFFYQNRNCPLTKEAVNILQVNYFLSRLGYIYIYTPGGQKRVFDCLELKLQAFVRCLMCKRETKPGPQSLKC